MKVHLLNYTNEAKDLLIFSKRTRHMANADALEKVKSMTEAEKDKELDYVFNTIGSSWEFVSYTFLIEDVTRAFTHQLVRHRVGTAFAQQAMRVARMEDFGYLVPPKFSLAAVESYSNIMSNIQEGYDALLVEFDADQQDARGVLPTNIHTNILFKVNLRAIADISHIRLCIRAQGEFQNVAFRMKKLIESVHPWAGRVLGPECIVNWRCAFPKYKQCPIKEMHLWLNGPADEEIAEMNFQWESITGYDPQPDIVKSWE